MKVIITIEVPDGTVSVNAPQNGAALHSAASAIFADDLEPLPPEPGTSEEGPLGADPLAPSARRGIAVMQPVSTLCPVHRVPWKVVPAGISKKTGKEYSAFKACPERGCDQRPA